MSSLAAAQADSFDEEQEVLTIIISMYNEGQMEGAAPCTATGGRHNPYAFDGGENR